jgi:hypothetical protein
VLPARIDVFLQSATRNQRGFVRKPTGNHIVKREHHAPKRPDLIAAHG